MDEGALKAWQGWTQPITRLKKHISTAQEKSLTGEERRSINRVIAKLGRFRDVHDRLFRGWPDLYVGKVGVRLSDREVNDLVEDVCRNDQGMAIRDAQRYLVSGLSRGVKELEWDLSVPAPFTSVSVLPSLFNTSTAERLAKYDALDDRYFEWIQKEGSDKCDMQRDAGELLFSFVFHNGITCPGWFDCLSRAIRCGVGNHQTASWLELAPSDSNGETGPDGELSRRIVLAPVTALLLRRWYRRWSDAWPNIEGDRALLVEFLTHLDSPKVAFREALAISEANLVTLLPGFLVHYARTMDLGKSLGAANWARLVTGQYFRTPTKKQRQIQLGHISYVGGRQLAVPNTVPGDQYHHFRRLQKWVVQFADYCDRSVPLPLFDRRKIWAEFRHRSTKDIHKIASSEGTSILVQMLCQYALFLIAAGENPSNELVAKARTFKQLRKLLDYSSDLYSELTLDADEWHQIYEAIVESSPGNDGEMQASFSGWHDFLHTVYGVEAAPLETSDGYGVDAALLTPTEFEIAKRQLLKADHDFGRIQLALLVLGYRCGLRRSEAWARTFDDFHGMEVGSMSAPELLVRPNKEAGVKSVSAVRRLPLAVLLPQDELNWLAEFVSERKRRNPSDSRRVPLFADPISGDFRVTEPHVFAALTRLLKDITGYEKFRFHHLRHSFASLTLVRLLENHAGELLDENGMLRFRVSHDNDGQANAPLWKRAGLGDSSSSLALLSQWMGHSSERVTLRSYAHLLDYLIGYYLRERLNPRLDLSHQQALLEKPTAALEKFRYRKRLTGGGSSATDLLLHLRMPNLQPLKGSPFPEAPKISSGPYWGAQINPLLPYRLAVLERQWREKDLTLSNMESLRRAARQLDIDDSLAEVWQRRATALFNIDMPKASKLKKFSLNDSSASSLPEFFSLIFHAPELPNFPTPPQSRAAFKQMMVWFGALADWVDREPNAACEVLSKTAESIQRSRPRIQPLGRQRQMAFIRFLAGLRLLKHFEVTLCVSQSEAREAQRYWSQKTGLPAKKFGLDHVSIELPPRNGLARFRLKSPGKAGSNFWSALRFLIFTGCVIYDAVPGTVDD